MGGRGSGEWLRVGNKTTLEDTKRIDIRYMNRQGLLKPGAVGTLKWSCGGKQKGLINFQCQSEYLQLSYRYREHDREWQPIEQRIRFDRTPCHYGGERFWFLCPGCHRRIAVLCCNGPLFLCRQCYQLPYNSQQQRLMDRLISQKHELGNRIFIRYENGKGWGKKKGMHWKTFNRLHAQYIELELQWWAHAEKYIFHY